MDEKETITNLVDYSNALKPHQKRCLDALEQALLETGNTRIHLCTGSGKTRIIFVAPALLHSKRVVFVFPTLALVDQFNCDYLVKYGFMFKHRYKVETNGISDEALREVVQTPEWCIATTYMSLPKVLSETQQIDMILFDEAHHADAPKCEDALKEHGHKIKYRIDASATLRSDENVCFRYPFTDAVRDGVCRDYNINCFVRRAGEDDIVRYLLDNLAKTGNGRVMAFTRYSEADRDGTMSVLKFTEQHRAEIEAHGGWIRAITGGTPHADRKAILDEFEKQPDDRLAMLVSCKTLSEGVDTQNANVSFFVDPESSSISIVQRIGRAVRKYRDKKTGRDLPDQRPGTVLVGIFLSPEKYLDKTDEEIDAILKRDMSENGDFGPIFRVLAALHQDDPETYQRCVHYPRFEALNEQVGRKGKEILDIPSDGFYDCLALHVDQDAEEIRQGVEDQDEEAAAEFIGRPISVHHAETGDVEQFGSGSDPIELLLDGDRYYPLVDKDDRSERVEAARKNSRKGGKIMLDIDPVFKMLFRTDAGRAEGLIAKIDIAIEYDGKSPEERAIERAKEIETFVRKNGREPNKRSTDQSEKQLGSKLDNMKKAARGTGTNSRYSAAEAILAHPDVLGPNWAGLKDLEALAVEGAEQIAEFVRKNRREPRTYSKDETEKQLGNKLNTMKSAVRGKGSWARYPSAEAILSQPDVLGPNWAGLKDLEALAVEGAEQIAEFVRKNRRVPSRNPKDETEKQLGQKLKTMKSAARGKGTYIRYPAAEAILAQPDVLGPNWTGLKDLDALAVEEAEQIAEFVRKNGREPNARSKDKTEKQLGARLQSMKSAVRGKGSWARYPSAEAILSQPDVLGPNWAGLKDLEALAVEGAEEIAEFIRKNGREPSRNSKDETEKQLGEKLNKMKSAVRGKSKAARYPSAEAILSQPDVLGPNWAGYKQNSPHSSIKDDQFDEKEEKASRIIIEDEPVAEERPAQKSMEFVPRKNSDEIGSPPVYSEHSLLLKTYKTMHSQTLAARFRKNRAEWEAYHAVSEKNEAGFGEAAPYKRVIEYLDKTLPPRKKKVVVDLGCGKARVSKAFDRPNIEWVNIDHVAADSSVREADIARTGLEDGEADVAILCLSMWGSNCEEYIQEAYRILDAQGGRLVIIEATKRWTESVPGDRLRELLQRTGFRIVEEEVRKFSMFVAQK